MPDCVHDFKPVLYSCGSHICTKCGMVEVCDWVLCEALVQYVDFQTKMPSYKRVVRELKCLVCNQDEPRGI